MSELIAHFLLDYKQLYSAYFQYFFDYITRKSQHIEQFGVQFKGTLRAGYDLLYQYADNSQQIANIADASYRVDRGTNGTYQLGKQAGDEVTVRAEDYTYDANGNLIYVLKGTRKPDSTLVATNCCGIVYPAIKAGRETAELSR